MPGRCPRPAYGRRCPWSTDRSSSTASPRLRHRLELEDLDLPRRALDRHTGARQTIKRLAVALQRRVHRRDLRLGPRNPPQRRLQLFLPVGRAPAAVFDDRSLAIPRRGPRAQRDREAVALAAGKDLAGDLGGLAEAHAATCRSPAGRDCLTCPALQPPSSRRTRCSAALDDSPARLVEQQDAAQAKRRVRSRLPSACDRRRRRRSMSPRQARGLLRGVIEYEIRAAGRAAARAAGRPRRAGSRRRV